jgi:hypothetical protein
VSLEWLNGFLPRFPVDAFAFFQMFVATFTAKHTSRRPPEMAFISIHWTCQLCLSHTATREQRIKAAWQVINEQSVNEVLPQDHNVKIPASSCDSV